MWKTGLELPCGFRKEKTCKILHVLDDAGIQRRFGGHIFRGRIDSGPGIGYAESIHGPTGPLGVFMEWTTPAFEEVCLNCEINSYVSAKL